MRQLKKLEAGMPIPVTITVYQDKSFTFETKQPPVSFFIKKALKLKKSFKNTRKKKQLHQSQKVM